MKRTATIEQRIKNRLFEDSNPLLSLNRAKQKQRAFDAATEYFKKYKTPLTDTLLDIFGPQFFARAALWLDPLADFRNAGGIIAPTTRYRKKPGFQQEIRVVSRNVRRVYQNYFVDDPLPVPEYQVGDDEVQDDDFTDETVGPQLVECWDTTNKSRKGSTQSPNEASANTLEVPFGEFKLFSPSSQTEGSPNVAFSRDSRKFFYFADGTIYPIYDRYTSDNTLDIGGSCTAPYGDLFLPNIDDLALTFMNDQVSDMIVRSVASSREFNLWYQFWEVRELPSIIRSIRSLRQVIGQYVNSPSKLLDLDKEIANLYLTWQFGVKSTYDAVRGLMKLPERVTKKINYLIDRANKVTTSRSKRSWLDYDFGFGVPDFEFFLPAWIEVSNSTVERRTDVELRCVINQTIQFPKLAVPSITDKDYRKLIGLEPNASDYINIIPWTWLIDWFGGLGSYVDVMSTTKSDYQLINFGFLTIVITEEVIHKADLKVRDTNWEGYINDDIELVTTLDESFERVLPYKKTYRRKYQRRVDIGSLEGVKSFGFGLRNLSSFQESILGALVSQRTK